MPKEKRADVLLEYQNYIETPPIQPHQLHQQACSNDTVTVNSWRNIWITNAKVNHAKYGPFKDHSIAKIYETQKFKPVILAGSGPTLKKLIPDLKTKGDICLVSCLHNFHFMEDNGIKVDYYVTLDAGEVTVEEVSEGGTKTPDEYWAMSKGKTLLAFISTSPRLLEKWQGEVLFFNCPIPDESLTAEIDAIETFRHYVSTGGNVLGAALYIAKGYLAANPIAFIGADFCFSYDKKFHSWDSKYDKNLGLVLKAVDVFGNKVLTWQSYSNFKGWFEWVALQVPGLYINCSEGGSLGSYPDGNIMAIRQMDLCDFIRMYNLHEHIRETVNNPGQPKEKTPILF
jgi:hypothetical protein